MFRRFLCPVLLALALATTPGAAVETLYYDDFKGPAGVDLNGTTPDISTSGATWQAGSWVKANGIFGGGSSGQMFTAALPFTPTIGAAYELSATLDNSGDWVGIAFLNTASNVSTRINDNAPLLWSLTRQTGASSKDQAFIGPGTGNGLGNTTTTSAAELKVRVEMNSDTDWLVSWYFDGSQQFQRTVNPVTAGITLNYVAFGTNGLFSACTGTVSSFKLVEIPQALKSSPAKGSLIYTTNVSLQWQAGIHAARHDVYIGTDSSGVENATTSTAALYKGRQDPNTYAVAGLTPGLTYYWRIDEVRADGTTIDKGEVWSFKVQPLTAYNPSPLHEAKYMDTGVDLAWSAGAKALSHDVYVGTDFDSVNNAKSTDPKGSTKVYRTRQSGTNYDPGVLALGTDYYWRIDEVNGVNVWQGDVWRFSTIPVISVTDPSLKGWWKFDEGQGTMALDWSGQGNHGTLINGPQWATSGKIDGALQFDGINDEVSLPIGSVIGSLTSSTYAVWVNWARVGATVQRIFDFGTGTDNYMFLSPGNGGGGGTIQFNITSSTAGGASQVASQTGLAAGWHHVAVTIDGINKTMQLYVDGDPNGNPGTTQALPSDLGNTTQNFLGGSQAADYTWFIGLLDDLRIYNKALTQGEIGRVMEGDPRLAWNPSPANVMIADIRNVLPMSWSAGDGAAGHRVYLGTDRGIVDLATPSDATGVYRGQQTGTTYTPPEGLAWGQTYYWRIDEVQSDETVIQGKVWTFSVADYLIVDDFEAYNDLCNRIFYTWVDGLGITTAPECGAVTITGNNSGSMVGNIQAPFADRTTFHNGSQSMPFSFNNTGSPFYSETVREWTLAQDWTAEGVNTLTVYMRGAPAAFEVTPSGTILMNGTGTDIWNAADEFRFAYKSLKGNGTIVAKVEGVSNVDPYAKAGVMIRETLDAGSTHALVDVTPGVGVEFIRRDQVAATATSTTVSGLAAPYWVKLTRNGSTFTAQTSVDGNTWTDIAVSPAITITMANEVFIGLAVTSRAANVVCGAKFTNVSTEGNVSGAWQVAEIGVPQVAGNTPETFYVAVEDSSKSAVYSYPDTSVIATGLWERVDIPLSFFSTAPNGVNIKAVKKLILGVGDRKALKAGGTGTLNIDDVLLTKGAN